MDKATIRTYLELIQGVLTDRVNESEITDNADGCSLLCMTDSPFDDEEEIGINISLDVVEGEENEGLLMFETIFYLAEDVGKKESDVEALIAEINPCVTLGAFKLFADASSLMYTQGFIADEEAGIGAATEVLGSTISVMEGVLANEGSYFYRLLKGEPLRKLVEEFESMEEEA